MHCRDDWYKSFFAGSALDLWRKAKSEAETASEVEFLDEMFDEVDATLLDLPCGNGRLSIPLGLRKYKVTGVDYSQEFLEEATKVAQTAKLFGKRIQFVQDDMRTLCAVANQFDGAFCFGNSFGYFNRQDTERMFNALSNHLKPGAKFVMDSSMIAETFLIHGGEREWVRVEDMIMLIENHYDSRESCVETEYTFISDGKRESRRAVHWIYTAGEVCAMLVKAKFRVIDMYGSIESEPFVLGSERLLLVAEKE